MINPQPGGSIYEQVAARLRHDITTGVLRPGQVIPSERSLAQQHGVGRETINRATRLLRGEGLLEHRRGQGLFVRDTPDPTTLHPTPGSTATVRVPSPQERTNLGLPEGVPVIVITAPDNTTTIHPADRTTLTW